MAKNKKIIGIVLALVLIPLGLLWTGLLINAQIQTIWAQDGLIPQPTRILYVVGNSAYSESYRDGPINALALDESSIKLTVVGVPLALDFNSEIPYDTIILNDVVLNESASASLSKWCESTGHGLIIIMGPQLTASSQLFNVTGILPGQFSFQLPPQEQYSYDTSPHVVTALSVLNGTSSSHLTKTIAWNSAPELVNYTIFPDVTINPNIHPVILAGFANGTVTSSPLVFTTSLIPQKTYDNVIIFAGWFGNGMNIEYQLWPYYNYLLFNAALGAANEPIPAYQDWNKSPVPHLFNQIGLVSVVAILITGSLLLFRRKRQQGLKARMKYQRIEAIEKELAEAKYEGTPVDYINNKVNRGETVTELDTEIMQGEKIANLTIKRVQSESKADDDKSKRQWEEIGFHRQQAGFMQMFFTLIFLVLPQLVITSFVMPQFIQPHPQAGGYYSFTLHFFEAIWLIFDMGTRYAFVKYFAEYRIEQPERAFHYAQIFVWWQFLSGLIQLVLFTVFGSVIFPRTSYAYLTWIFIAHSLVQFPGIFQVLQYFFQAMQKTDKQMITFVLQMFLLRLVAQVITVPIFRAIYANQFMYGDAFGAGLGLVVGQYVGDIMMFGITIIWYRQLNLSFAPIFAVEFTAQEFKKSLKFGFKMAMGEMLVPSVWLLQVLLVSIYIPSYAAEQGYYELANTIASLTAATTLLYEGIFGALTEAHKYNKKTLLDYTSGASMRLGMFWTFFMCGALFAIGPMFIIGTAGAGWRRAADLLPLFVIFNILGPFSWQGDKEFASAERPELAGIAWIIEQSLRAIFMFVLLASNPIMEMVIYAYTIALIVKDIFVWIMVEKKIHKHHWYFWPTFIAPGLAGIVTYLFLKILADMISPNILTVLLIFVLTFFVFLDVFSFFVGLFGGYDDNTIAEFEKSAYMTGGLAGVLSKLLYKSAKLGTKLSPLHNKFRIDIYEQAYQEAAEINAKKQYLV